MQHHGKVASVQPEGAYQQTCAALCAHILHNCSARLAPRESPSLHPRFPSGLPTHRVSRLGPSSFVGRSAPVPFSRSLSPSRSRPRSTSRCLSTPLPSILSLLLPRSLSRPPSLSFVLSPSPSGAASASLSLPRSRPAPSLPPPLLSVTGSTACCSPAGSRRGSFRTRGAGA